MRAIVDDSIIIALDNYFTNNIDDYQRGVIRYPLENLISGKHKIEIKVSDNYNNLSSKTVVFIIDNENKLKIDNLMNYPNPFTDFTTFSFDNGEFEEPLSINLNVYDLRGNIVYNYENIYEFSPEKIDNIIWDGKDLNNYPLPQGIYIYKLHVVNLNNNAEFFYIKNYSRKMRFFTIILFISINQNLFSQVGILSGQDTSRRPIITAVPFLLISPDSRGSAMGETGVATSPDANSIHWNNAKLSFIDKKYGFGLSYVPWLGKIVDDMSISYLSGFYKIDEVQAVGLTMKYFDLGEIQLTDNQGLSLGIENPKELSSAFTYSRKLTNNLSLGGTARYIWSNLAGSISNYSDAKAGNSFSVDLGFYYNKEITITNRTSELSFGTHISNIGGKITYGSSKSLDFIPANLRFGTSLKTFLDQYNSITLAFDLNKLMVPSPPIYEIDQNGDYVIDPNK